MLGQMVVNFAVSRDRLFQTSLGISVEVMPGPMANEYTASPFDVANKVFAFHTTISLVA